MRNVDPRADSKTALSLIIPRRISYSRSHLYNSSAERNREE